MGAKVKNTIWTPKSQQILNALNVFCNIEHHSVKEERTLFEHQVLSGFTRKNTNWSLGTERLHVFKNMCSGIEHNLNTNNATDIEHLERVL